MLSTVCLNSCKQHTRKQNHHRTLAANQQATEPVGQGPEKSSLCQHSMKNDHLIDWSEVKISKVEHNYSKRLFTESWYINEKHQVLNRNDGLSFPAVYRKLLNSQC